MLSKFSVLAGIILVLLTACTPTSVSTPIIPTTTPIIESSEPQQYTAESRGEALFVESIEEVGFACASCHYLTSARLIGPGMAEIANRFETYNLDISLQEYIRLSITDPTAYIVQQSPAYPANVMPSSYSDLFNDAQLDDLVSYILSL